MGGESKVGDFVTLQRGTTYKGRLVGEPGPALLGLGSIVPGGGFREGDYKTYGGDCPQKLMLYPGDLFASLKGATKDGKMIGSVARVPESVPSGRLTQDTVKLEFENSDKEFSNYLYWVLRTPQYRDYCDRHATGSAVVALSRDDFLNYPVPSLNATRKRIVSLLEFIEYKIELNRQMNATLEAMAQALFKSWFVDFDPVIDNALAAGNPIPEELQARADARAALGDKRKSLPEAIQKQFPSRFVFSEEMGWVPEGWESVATEEIAEKIGMGPFGSNIKVSTFVEAGVPIISGFHLNRTLLTDENYNYITEDHAKKVRNSLVRSGDIIFTHAGNIGQVSVIPESTKYPKYVISQRQFFLRPKLEKVYSSYLIYFFRSHIGQHKLLANASQVGVPSIARPSSHLKSINFLLPTLDLLEFFDSNAKAIFKSSIAHEEQSNVLIRLRDTLLPKLLSGELRIPDAEKLAAEAAV